MLKISSVQRNIAKVGEIASTSVLLNWRHENLPPRCSTIKFQKKNEKKKWIEIACESVITNCQLTQRGQSPWLSYARAHAPPHLSTNRPSGQVATEMHCRFLSHVRVLNYLQYFSCNSSAFYACAKARKRASMQTCKSEKFNLLPHSANELLIAILMAIAKVIVAIALVCACKISARAN